MDVTYKNIKLTVLMLFILLGAAFSQQISREAMQKSFPAQRLKRVRQVTTNNLYSSSVLSFEVDGLTQYALLSIPQGKAPLDGFPLILMLHGHINPAYYRTVGAYKGVFAAYARSGYAVLMPDYRGHGESEGRADLSYYDPIYYTRDALQLLSSLSLENNINTDVLFLYGHSMGGTIAFHLLELYPSFKAAVLWAPVAVSTVDAALYYRGERFGKTRGEMQEAALEELKSLGIRKNEVYLYLDHLDKIKTPIIIRHADTDEVTPYKWSTAIVTKLKQANIDVELKTYRNDNHNLAKNQNTILQDDIEYFKEHEQD